MAEQILIGKFPKGQDAYYLPFAIDNSSFPTLFNFYVWRGRVKRKRGTELLGQLKRQITVVAVVTHPWEKASVNLSGGAINLISAFSLQSSSSIVPGSLSLVVGANTYTEPATPDGTLVGAPAGSGTINYSTGAVTISGGGASALTGTFSYFPELPVMGLRDLSIGNTTYPVPLAFDTVYSYQLTPTANPTFYNVNYYKGSNVPFVWSGQNYQQFWTTNYSGALWSTNAKPGFHVALGTYSSGSGTANITMVFTNQGSPIQTLVAGTSTTGDQVWFNEWAAGGVTINGLNGYISSIVNAATGTYVVTFSGNQTVSSTGIAQLLTNSISGQDGIKWYDGDPTGGSGIPTGSANLGWVNFSPPLTATSVAIDTYPSALYYLVGAVAIVPFKDRLLFFGPQIITSTSALAGGTPLQLPDTVLWSWRGTPYYNSLIPTNQTSSTTAYYVDQTGLGGYLPAGIPQAIASVSTNEDVLLIGFSGNGRKTRFVYTGNDIQPFLFFTINSELPSTCLFSAITLDKGAIDIGTYGISMTDQQSSQRVDLDIPDEVFRISNANNGTFRVNAIRDFFREWIYFSYPLNTSKWSFPTQSFLFNYRDNTWAILYENFTTHGRYRPTSAIAWKDLTYKSWNEWTDPWNSGDDSPLYPNIIAGNPQGYVLVKDKGTGESVSGTIQAIANSASLTQITSTNHCVKVGDYLYFSGALGTTAINGQIGRVISTANANTFVVDILAPSGTYLGLGKYTRLIQPFLQTKQFNPYWEQGRKVRLSAQKYLMDATPSGQVTVNIYLSMDPTTPWNDPTNTANVYSQLMYTCQESTNIGLTPANTNLQMPTAETQFQIWHRFNTSLIGDTVQVGITLSDAQMRNLNYAVSDIVLQGIHLTTQMGPHLA